MSQTETVECRHCGREHEVSGGAKAFGEAHTDGKFCCSGCFGLEPLTEELREELPECHVSECDDPAPFQIKLAEGGPVNRCRECLNGDLKNGMWDFYLPEQSPKTNREEA